MSLLPPVRKWAWFNSGLHVQAADGSPRGFAPPRNTAKTGRAKPPAEPSVCNLECACIEPCPKMISLLARPQRKPQNAEPHNLEGRADWTSVGLQPSEFCNGYSAVGLGLAQTGEIGNFCAGVRRPAALPCVAWRSRVRTTASASITPLLPCPIRRLWKYADSRPAGFDVNQPNAPSIMF
jgi:hypothetical protein